MKIVSYRGCFPLFIILLVLLSSCTLERKLAKDYLRNHKGNAIMIVPAWGIYKQNLTVDIDSIGKYTNQQLDSIAWNQSALVKKISDSIFLTQIPQ